jgi:hypothetical protein
MNEKNQTPQYIQRILDAIQKIQYGSVEITIHASEIVQIETKEKVRFENRSTSK